MSALTEKAIKESLLKLLAQKPLNKISVKDIADDCGINRNSFYYHFQDIPALLEEMIVEICEDIIKEYPSIESIDDCINAAFRFAVNNRKVAYHIYNSVNRDVFERELMKMCGVVVSKYVDEVVINKKLPKEDGELIIRFIKCQCFGLIIDWLENGMTDEAMQDLTRMKKLISATFDNVLLQYSLLENEEPVE